MIVPVHSPLNAPSLLGMGVPPHQLPGATAGVPADRGEVDVSVDLSPTAVLLSEEGLDFSTSSVEALSLGMDFRLEFTSGSVEKLTASGSYSEETRSLHMSWHFTFQKEVAVEGGTELRTFEADLQVSISQVDRKTVTRFSHKEDIIALVRRLMEDIQEIAADDKRILGGVVLDYHDFRELFALDHGKMARDLLALIELTITLARLKQMLGEQPKEAVILRPERRETEGMTVSEESMTVEHFRLQIRHVTVELSREGAEEPSASPPGLS